MTRNDHLRILCYRFNVEDTEYRYDIGICTNAIDPIPPDADPKVAGAGVVQFNKKDESYKIIGQYAHADIVAGRMFDILYTLFI